MRIRDAAMHDAAMLQTVMEHCPQGSGLVFTVVNSPDFFARSRAYEHARVFVAEDDGHLAGSAACAVRTLMVNGLPARVGYEFQYFTCPNHRRRGTARFLRDQIEAHLRSSGVAITTAILARSNTASRGLFERAGFEPIADLICRFIFAEPYLDMLTPHGVRTARESDLFDVAELLNYSWRHHNLAPLMTASELARFLTRTPGIDLDRLLVLDRGGRVRACAGLWDWSASTKFRIHSVEDSTAMGLPTRLPLEPGSVLNQWGLSQVGFETDSDLYMLLRVAANQSLALGIERLAIVAEAGSPLLEASKGFDYLDVDLAVFAKSLSTMNVPRDRPLYVDIVDL